MGEEIVDIAILHSWSSDRANSIYTFRDRMQPIAGLAA